MPELSVVIPTLARLETLSRVLRRLEEQSLAPQRYEVIVVADAAEAEPSVVGRAVGKRPYAAAALEAEVPGASAARNCGWRASQAPVVLFLGDDILPSSRLLAEHLAWHRRHPDDRVAVLGQVRWARELRPSAFMRWLEAGIQFDFRGISGLEAGWGRFYTANASVKRSAIDAVGGFDERLLPYLYEDLDLAYRMHKQVGLRVLYNRSALAEHLHPTDLDSWRKRIAAVAVAERAFVRKHPEIEPYFLRMFERALETPPGRGRGARLVHYVPRHLPWLGARVWASADLHFRRLLAPHFLSAWHEAERGDG